MRWSLKFHIWSWSLLDMASEHGTCWCTEDKVHWGIRNWNPKFFQLFGPEVVSTPSNSSLGLLLKVGDNFPGACGSIGCTLQYVKFAQLEHFCEEKHGETDSCLWKFQFYFSQQYQSDSINLWAAKSSTLPFRTGDFPKYHRFSCLSQVFSLLEGTKSKQSILQSGMEKGLFSPFQWAKKLLSGNGSALFTRKKKNWIGTSGVMSPTSINCKVPEQRISIR